MKTIKLNSTVYSLYDNKINGFTVIKEYKIISVDGETETHYMLSCNKCDKTFLTHVEGDYLYVDEYEETCEHTDYKFYISKRKLNSELIKLFKKNYETYINEIENIKKYIKENDEKINKLKHYDDNELKISAGDKIYGYNRYIYKVIEINYIYGVKVLKLECESCRHGFNCIINVIQKNKNEYDFISIDNDDPNDTQIYHHQGYTYYPTRELVELHNERMKRKYNDNLLNIHMLSKIHGGDGV